MVKIIYVVIRRYLELLLPQCLLSAIFRALFKYAFQLNETQEYIMITAIFLELAIFFAINVFTLRACYFGCKNNFKYAVGNILANGMLLVTNIGLYFVLSKANYTWFFALFKSFHYVNEGMLVSALIVHMALFLMIFAAPFGMKFDEEEEEDLVVSEDSYNFDISDFDDPIEDEEDLNILDI